MNKKSQHAWELYLKMDTSTQSFNLLQLIANTCYTVGEFWYAAKAFDMLNKLDPSPEYWEGKRGACCGTFQYIVAQKQSKYEYQYFSINLKIKKQKNKNMDLFFFIVTEIYYQKSFSCLGIH